MSNNPSIKKNYVFNLLYNLLTLIVPLITTPYLSRVLGSSNIGVCSYVLSITTYFSLMGTLGLSTYGQLKISELRDDTNRRSLVFYEIQLLRFILMGISIALYIFFIIVFNKNVVLYLLTGIYLIATVFDISWFFQGIEDFKVILIRNLVLRAISVVLIFLLVKQESDLTIYIVVLHVSTLLGNLSMFPHLKTSICKLKSDKIHPFIHFVPCLSFFIPTIATTVYTVLDKSMIGWITSSSYQNGVYEQAHKIELILLTIITSIGVVTLPRMTYMYKNNNEEGIRMIVQKSIKYVLLISIPMCFGVIAVSDLLIPLFLGSGFDLAAPLLKIFSVLLVVVGLDNTIGKQCLVSTGCQRKFNIGVIIGAIANLICNIILIPRYGAVGAAIGSVVAETVILFIFIYFSRKLIAFKQLLWCFTKYLSLSAIMYIFISFIKSQMNECWVDLLFVVICGSMLYFVSLLIIKDAEMLSLLKALRGRLKH